MKQSKDNFAAIIVAAGSGSRFGSAKQFERVGDLAAYQFVARTFSMVRDVQALVVVGREEDLTVLDQGLTELKLGIPHVVVAGGETRQQSVLYGLLAISKHGLFVNILVHDAARVLVGEDIIQRVIDATRKYGSAIPALPVVDTLKRVEDDSILETIPRHHLFRAQTPQGARLSQLLAAYQQASIEDVPATDEAELLERIGERPHIVLGSEQNFKITYAEDLVRARSIVEAQKLSSLA